MLDAIGNCYKMRKNELHENERPLSMMAAVYINSVKDPKKGKAASMDQYYLYEPKELRNLPDSIYGAAALALISKGKMPYWALFAYNDLRGAASGSPPPILALIGESAMILAPVINEKTVRGMIIAQEQAFETECVMIDDHGIEWVVEVPPGNSKFIALENIEMPITRLVH